MRKLLGTLAALLLLAGGVVTWIGVDQQLSGGYFGSAEERFTSATAVLKTDEIDVRETTAHPADPMPDVGELARVRIVIRPADPRARLFIGIGPKPDVERYLKGTAHGDFAGAELSPFKASFHQVPGTPAAPDNPQAQPFWVASASGTGTQVLEWDKTSGPWSFVVIRQDGAGLDLHGWIGLRFGFLLPVGTAFLALAALMAVWLVKTRHTATAGP